MIKSEGKVYCFLTHSGVGQKSDAVLFLIKLSEICAVKNYVSLSVTRR